MGKVTGFLDYTRKNNPAQAPLDRIEHWKEFHPMLTEADRRQQGARCMDCGVPFCQSGVKLGGSYTGCPLHNLVPEWNDLLYTGNLAQALERLHKANNFPEFTGRVCPALCEAACVCGLHGAPVTVKDNELGIVEEGFAQGLIQPRVPAHRTGKRIAIVGSGPAGLAAADQLNQRGHSVTVFERDDRIGGLLMYGIPSMKLEKKYVKRRVELLEAEGITFVTGVDVGKDKSAQELLAEYDAVLLCTGARQARDITVPGREAKGVHLAMEYLTATGKSYLNSKLKDGNYINAAGKDVIVVGGGDTGSDCIGVALRHGCKSVHQLVKYPRLPDRRPADNCWPEWPKVNKNDYSHDEAIARFGEDPRIFQTTVKELLTDEKGELRAVKTIRLEGTKRDKKTGKLIMTEVPGTEEELPCQLLLVAIGFQGPESYVAQAFGVETDARTNLKTVDYATSVAGVFAAGDARRGQSLVVWAIQEGRAAAREVDRYLMGYTSL
ncbi:glutamate synthase subunit beta [Pseudoflavonifractor phocaeensis]|uniref:glutamate synthase subunit beta n=1 Tax=Pseudoflavonifractor phocaeensis TaxID=1870988 RepID=UPI001F483234|nr:glutamate synthase subunit beta [Pseudoflavonifractor phocaeensis]MCF2661857.1 glutamate synthase subunit beta [Pseudoflavonifractor phocaeensis]